MSFWKPNLNDEEDEDNDINFDRDISKENNINFINNINEKYSIDIQRKKLPIYSQRDKILFAIEKYQVLIIVGETGSVI
jgi:ATP-dependent RNA helicase DDX35